MEPAWFGAREVDVRTPDRLELIRGAADAITCGDEVHSFDHQQAELSHAALRNGSEQVLLVREVPVCSVVRDAGMPGRGAEHHGVGSVCARQLYAGRDQCLAEVPV